jgi:hypothetical protein
MLQRVSHKWNDLVFSIIIISVKVNFKINYQLSGFFSTYRGVVQGPLSPILFNIVVDSLSVMVKNVQQVMVIVVLVSSLQENGIAIFSMHMIQFYYCVRGL